MHCHAVGGGGSCFQKRDWAYCCWAFSHVATVQGLLMLLAGLPQLPGAGGEGGGGRIKIAWYIYTVKTYVTRHDLHFSVPLSRLLH